MKLNTLTPSISHQIAYHYASIIKDTRIIIKKSNIKSGNSHMTQAVGGANKIKLVCGTDAKPVIIHFVSSTVKNKYSASQDGLYANFMAKYRTTSTANKKHAEFNTLQHIKVFGLHNFADTSAVYELKAANKLFDIADSFMMIRNWLIDKKML